MSSDIVYLPYPSRVSSIAVEEAILLRRSIRSFKQDPIKLEHLSMILWAAYGITDPVHMFRASPSAGATYPLEVYSVIGEKGVLYPDGKFLDPGVYRYIPDIHALKKSVPGDVRKALAKAALGQRFIAEAPVDIVVTAVFRRTTEYYGKRGEYRYVPMDVGHMGQNIYLMAVALGYGTVAVGAFSDRDVAEVIKCGDEEVPMYIMPIGIPRSVRKVDFKDISQVIEMQRGREVL